ncbi:NUDIX hydrolase [Haliea sp.]|uniref:NUDIX hydrolase n=1 Tax=Haliea sp. TaxID=1932666 RepID=UPI0032EFEC9C
MISAPRFCDQCGKRLEKRLVPAEGCYRMVCAGCGEVTYRNPKVLVSTIVGCEERILLCRRAIAPAVGKWCLPGGFVECCEPLEVAAARETHEETGIIVNPGTLRLHAVFTLTDISEVYVSFLGVAVDDATPLCGPECLDVGYFDESNLPWNELAFSDIGWFLRLYFRELRSGRHAVHFSRIDSAGVVGRSYLTDQIQEVNVQRASLNVT